MKARSKRLDVKYLFWIFLSCSVVGCIYEMILALFHYGHFEVRQGVIFGPFYPIYGVGAVLAYILVVPASQRSWLLAFFTGALTGGAVEFAGSYFDEIIIGMRSWDYSALPGSIGGRTCLPFMCVWGILGCAFSKWGDPALRHCYDRVPAIRSRAWNVSLTLFFVLNIAVSALAVNRWAARLEGRTPEHRVDVFFDEYFSDRRMEKIFPDMRRVN